jgi:hypothetical protein
MPAGELYGEHAPTGGATIDAEGEFGATNPCMVPPFVIVVPAIT